MSKEKEKFKHKNCTECHNLIVNACDESEEKGMCKECYDEASEFYEDMYDCIAD